MQNNVLEYLEATVEKVPEKIAYSDGNSGLTFREVYEQSRAIGTTLFKSGVYGKPVIIYMKKSPQTIAAFFGCIYGGDFYVPVDETMPEYRIKQIVEASGANVAICDKACSKKAEKILNGGMIFSYEDILSDDADDNILDIVRQKAIDTDPIYIVFTSGSTGVPKGVAACHRSVIDYVENLSKELGFNEDTVFANQSPFYFDACLKELYPTIMFGATTYIVPKSLFMFPVKLVEYLNEHKVNTICWVVSALTIISSVGTFDVVKPEYLTTVAFGSEVFPIRQFKLWKEALPDAAFFNLYGPTECTGMSCFYKVEGEYEDTDVIPIGKPFKNTQIMLLDDDDKLADEGEIVIRGTCVTLGYYNNPEKTKEAFVQNPLNTAYPELVYRTGDIGRYNDNGELVFISRKDYQIKHMGHRIELGEIEAHANTLEDVYMSACVYDSANALIVLFYTGEADEAGIMEYLKDRLPKYMLPNKIKHMDVMPFTDNGKINRNRLKEIL